MRQTGRGRKAEGLDEQWENRGLNRETDRGGVGQRDRYEDGRGGGRVTDRQGADGGGGQAEMVDEPLIDFTDARHV